MPTAQRLGPRVCWACRSAINQNLGSVKLRGRRNYSVAKATSSTTRLPIPSKRTPNFVPPVLNLALGLRSPPAIGQNTGKDERSWRQRSNDYTDYDKREVKWQSLKKQLARPYFRDWSNLNYEKGKSFVANPRLLKADTALYFPNLHGNTLVPGSNGVDTTPLLKNKISIVAVFSCVWAERQVQSFLDATKNPELHKAVQSNLSTIQFVNISFEDNLMKSFLVRLFTYRLRRQTAEEDWRRYFFINKGMSDEMLEAMGVMNRKVGYVYLVDRNCRIRWAGSGDATGDELRYMVEGLKKLLDESRSLPKVRYIPKKPLPPTELYDTLVS